MMMSIARQNSAGAKTQPYIVLVHHKLATTLLVVSNKKPQRQFHTRQKSACL